MLKRNKIRNRPREANSRKKKIKRQIFLKTRM